jgi:hypothetical protein
LPSFTYLTIVILNLIYFFALSRSICTPAVQKDFEPFFWSSAANTNMDFCLFCGENFLQKSIAARVSAIHFRFLPLFSLSVYC